MTKRYISRLPFLRLGIVRRRNGRAFGVGEGFGLFGVEASQQRELTVFVGVVAVVCGQRFVRGGEFIFVFEHVVQPLQPLLFVAEPDEQLPDFDAERRILRFRVMLDRQLAGAGQPLLRGGGEVEVRLRGGGFGQFVYALTLLSKQEMQPATVGIYSFVGAEYADWHRVMAFSSVFVLPILVLFLLLQRRIVAGLTAGALK